jgi:single stranded DNA-binding protein
LNEVALAGKVSRVGQLKYTPSGKPQLDFTLAVATRVLDADSIGYVEAVLFGSPAEDSAKALKIGRRISIRGQLWVRNYKNRQGTKVNEAKVICTSLELAETKSPKEFQKESQKDSKVSQEVRNERPRSR